jgi:hypothetical protein
MGLSLSADALTWNVTRQTIATNAAWKNRFIILRFLGLLLMLFLLSDAKMLPVSEMNLK